MHNDGMGKGWQGQIGQNSLFKGPRGSMGKEWAQARQPSTPEEDAPKLALDGTCRHCACNHRSQALTLGIIGIELNLGHLFSQQQLSNPNTRFCLRIGGRELFGSCLLEAPSGPEANSPFPGLQKTFLGQHFPFLGL